MNLQELKLDLEKKEETALNASNAYNKKIDEISKDVEKVVLDLYGVTIGNSTVRVNTWSDTLEIDIIETTQTRRNYSINISAGERNTLDIGTINGAVGDDMIILTSALLADYKGNKGLFSVVSTLQVEILKLKTTRHELSNIASTARADYQIEMKSKQMGTFFDVIGVGHVITDGGSGSESWNITKITKKCVYVIHMDYGDNRSRRYSKDEFFKVTKDYVNLTIVE